ncbi:MAG: deoxyhypusine synthase family protein [Elusimicrobia bacterium]|nr:deoxyhypusine synthase family protein [Elusimicrobiota bacterium]
MLNLKNVKRCSLEKRKSKVRLSMFANPVQKEFLETVPNVLAGKNFKELVKRIIAARKNKKPVIFMFGAHIIKCGLSRFVIDMMKRNIITAIATNGASIIHDFELAYCGKTSEDVEKQLKDGKFGMVFETGKFINEAVKYGAERNLGLGEAIGKMENEKKLKFYKESIFGNAYKLKIPATVHVGIGTDIIYQHPECDGASWGKTSYNDFLKFSEIVSKLEGGVILNFGSAVILPEVFLKALNLVRNLGYKVRNFTAANFDMNYQYRAFENVVSRPAGNNGFYFIGHHEIMFPLLHRSLLVKSFKNVTMGEREISY